MSNDRTPLATEAESFQLSLKKLRHLLDKGQDNTFLNFYARLFNEPGEYIYDQPKLAYPDEYILPGVLARHLATVRHLLRWCEVEKVDCKEVRNRLRHEFGNATDMALHADRIHQAREKLKGHLNAIAYKLPKQAPRIEDWDETRREVLDALEGALGVLPDILLPKGGRVSLVKAISLASYTLQRAIKENTWLHEQAQENQNWYAASHLGNTICQCLREMLISVERIDRLEARLAAKPGATHAEGVAGRNGGDRRHEASVTARA